LKVNALNSMMKRIVWAAYSSEKYLFAIYIKL